MLLVPEKSQCRPMIQPRHPVLGTLRFLATAMLGLLMACPATLAAGADCEARALRAHESIRAEDLANWEPVDDHTLLVWTLHDPRAHLVSLEHSIPGLRGAPTVILVTPRHDPNVCACGHDAVLVPGGGAARISSIRYLSEKRTAELDPGGATSRARTSFT